MVNYTSLNGLNFNELDASEFLTVGNGVTVNADGTYTITPDVFGALANYDNWSGSLGNPQAGDITTVSLTTGYSNPGSTYGVVGYTITFGDGSVAPPAPGVNGLEVVAWNSTEVLLEDLSGFIPNFSQNVVPGGNYILVGSKDLSTLDGSVASNASFTLGTTGPFPSITLCFLRGTTLATPRGEVPVELLQEGDLVVTASGAVRPIQWIGKGKVLAHRYRRTAATPVVIKRGAFGHNVPNRDLRVTKGHSFSFDGVLIPVEFLVNHRSILWDDLASSEVELYHVELETHDLLIANGAIAESYRDDGNRWLFQNANRNWMAPPKPPCAPVLTGGAIVDDVWRRLLDRAGPRPGLSFTDDADLHLLVNGRRVDGERMAGGAIAFQFGLGPDACDVRICSRSAAPDELGIARDPRQLGVSLSRIVIRNNDLARTVEASDQRLTDGFHGYEATDNLRWTDGEATLPADLFEHLFGQDVRVELHLAGSMRYIDFGKLSKAA